ncbi:hypothetical protein [uncultured Thiohalocapsa sp.]|uniref:hypothetical protein n=1 Tax=uncultured Thiohalocapsa sp. TaxID=768990 RepID=UPI0025EB40F7|nr:hypothetical protein [uncultured Thiohalocapsa sp.]
MNIIYALIVSFGVATTLCSFAQMQPAPPPVGEVQSMELTATVEDIDADERLLTLKGPENRVVIVRVSPDVPNLDQIEPGDQVDVLYYRAALQEAEKLDPSVERSGRVIERGSATGTVAGMPAGIAARTVRETVEVLGVDEFKKAVAFRDMNGRYREVSVDAPHLAHWLDDPAEGDKVRLAYTEAVAVQVEPK